MSGKRKRPMLRSLTAALRRTTLLFWFPRRGHSESGVAGALQEIGEQFDALVDNHRLTRKREDANTNPRYIVERSGQRSDRLAGQEDVEEFLTACAIQKDSQDWHAALAGVPVEVDGGSMRFIAVDSGLAGK